MVYKEVLEIWHLLSSAVPQDHQNASRRQIIMHNNLVNLEIQAFLDDAASFHISWLKKGRAFKFRQSKKNSPAVKQGVLYWCRWWYNWDDCDLHWAVSGCNSWGPVYSYAMQRPFSTHTSLRWGYEGTGVVQSNTTDIIWCSIYW